MARAPLVNPKPSRQLLPGLYQGAQRDGTIGLLVFVACMALYLLTASPSVVMGDGGEMQMVSALLGVAHPTGYPLFTLLGYVFTRLPLGGDAAYRVTLLCMCATAAAMAFLYLLAREIGVGRLPSLFAALLAATAPVPWSHATAAEVYGLSSLFIVLGLWLLLRWGGGNVPLWAVMLAFGVGLTHHISLRLLGPAVLAYLLTVEPHLLLKPRRWLPALVCLLLPLVLYAYIPLRAAYFDSLPQWAGDILGVKKTVVAGYVSPHYYAQGSLGLILALDYSGTFFSQGATIGLRVLKQYADLTRQQFPLAMIPIAFLGVGVLLHRQKKASLLLLLSYAGTTLAALWFLARVGEDGDHFIPSYLLLAIWFGAGAQGLLEWTAQRLRAWPLHHTVLLGCLAILPAANLIAHFPQALQNRQLNPELNVLQEPLPRGAVLAGEWNYVTPLRYRQRVEGVRPDLWIIHADLIGTRLLMQRARQEQVPFYAVRPTPAGVRLLPLPLHDASAIGHPTALQLGPAVTWQGYDLEPKQPAPGEWLKITLYWQAHQEVDRDWTTFIHLVTEAGEKVAQVDQTPGDGYAAPSTWQPGQLMADQYELQLPADLRAGRYRLIFGWYSGGERLKWADGRDSQVLAEFRVGG